jgi:hypothetical protein
VAGKKREVAGTVEAVPFGEGFQIPTVYTWEAAGPRFGWMIEVNVIDGKPRCVGVAIKARDGDFIDPSEFHRIPLGQLIEDATVLAARPVGEPFTQKRWSTIEEARREQAAADRHYRRVRRRPATNRITDEVLDQVAAIYREHETRGNPTQAVADKLHLARSTAGRWVMKARQAGKLPPARKETDA